MQQRQLRLGDILDDYCPRERRLANHTVVAMVGDDVRLTRCTTCDTEHPYKGGKLPRLRKKSSVAAAYDEVLESVKKETNVPGVLVTHAEPVPAEPTDAEAPAPAEAAQAPPDETSPDAAPDELVRLHRPLIRASLPRVEAQATPRPIPEFTMRQANRQGRFQKPGAARFGKGRGGGGGNDHQGNSRGPGGPQGSRQGGRPQGHGGPPRQGQGRHPGQNPGRKRSR